MKKLNFYTTTLNSENFEPKNYIGEINEMHLKAKVNDDAIDPTFCRATNLNYPALKQSAVSMLDKLVSADIIVTSSGQKTSILDKSSDFVGDIKRLGLTQAIAINAPIYLKDCPANKTAAEHLSQLKKHIIASKDFDNTMMLQRMPYGRFSNRTYLPINHINQAGEFMILDRMKRSLEAFEKWTKQANMIVEAANKYNAKKSNTPVEFTQGTRKVNTDNSLRLGTDTSNEVTITLSGSDFTELFNTQQAKFNADGTFAKEWSYVELFDYDKSYSSGLNVVLNFKDDMFTHTMPVITIKTYDWTGSIKDVNLMVKSSVEKKWVGRLSKHVNTLKFNGVWDNRTTGLDLFVERTLQQGESNLSDIIQRKKDEQDEIVLNNTINKAYRDEKIDTRAYKRLADLDFVSTECEWEKISSYSRYASRYQCIEVTLKNSNRLIYCRAAAKNGELKLLGGISAEKLDNRISADKVLELMA
ncbi:MAG: hypothetical protein Unbinned2072contig1001_13 [Prokaryotic dsDNA virus sp.]|nr:MAG: hypothetical protein Unbinned2072contig1001_13 [Prokaryotic dsDNA virus sp.]|tara:strand:- start:7381 stop:8796 length:1416 start_codon:yes stop_codon:yes gene_type:complete